MSRTRAEVLEYLRTEAAHERKTLAFAHEWPDFRAEADRIRERAEMLESAAELLAPESLRPCKESERE